MTFTDIITVCFISFIVSIFSVSVRGTSLLTVPLLISFGMTSKNAVATNMFALIFLSISGTTGFRKEIKSIQLKTFNLFATLIIWGSFIGAYLILPINEDILKKVIAIIILIVACSFLIKKDLGIQERKEKISKVKFILGAILIFVLSIYAGFFSGGYITLSSYVLISIFRLDFLQAAFTTKIFNIFSSIVACTLFHHYGLIDFSLGIPLAFSMFLGAYAGAKLPISKGNHWIRKFYIIAVIALAINLLFFL